MAVVLTFGAELPVVKVGRMAGQFAKPRSSPTEVQDGVELPSYRGDIINGLGVHAEARTPDPARHAAGLSAGGGDAQPAARLRQGGYADLHRVHPWKLGFVADSRRRDATRAWPTASPRRWTSCGLRRHRRRRRQCERVDFYTSHEALLLGYEEALTRVDSTTRPDGTHGSGHMLWIGDRTRQPDGAHVEFCRGVRNPIGLKCGPA
ncbi:MAG: hypothetical protein KatS3mg118_0138 [Paracoccaceae bacterium]|nr:MAG: hypothetical protein KatS3mg118_0138 [Paracoccaceae bacterium]